MDGFSTEGGRGQGSLLSVLLVEESGHDGFTLFQLSSSDRGSILLGLLGWSGRHGRRWERERSRLESRTKEFGLNLSSFPNTSISLPSTKKEHPSLIERIDPQLVE